MSAPMFSSRAIVRQSRHLFRQQQRRQASSATEKASEVASSAKETAQNVTSKASEGLTKVTSSAGSSVSNAAASAQATAGNVGGRVGRMINFVQSLIPPTIYYGRVGLELGRMIVQHQKMAPPSVSSFQSYLQPVTNAVRNPGTISSALPSGQVLGQARNASREQLTNYAIVIAQVLGFFTVGEMIGRLKLVGYHGEVYHEEH